jgi:SpoIVB peptidase S55
MDQLQVGRRNRYRVGRAVIATAMLAAGVTATADSAAAAPPEGACPRALPVREVTAGLTGTGLTVSRGQKPERFSAEVLGVLAGGIAPDVPMIVARTESPTINRVHGIWAGMSGSPVYAPDGRLIGAVAYGLTFGASKIAGITPGVEMLKLLRDPARVPTPLRQNVALTEPLQKLVVRAGAASAQQAAGGMQRLPLPFTVSGLTDPQLARFTGKLPTETRVIRGAGVAAGVRADPSLIRPGGNLAAAISLGDVTAAGVGTATVVCDGKALGFGHPMIYSGRSSLSANAADAIGVQDDPLGAPFKLANIKGVVGGVDEDRRAGIRVRLGPEPAAAPVTSTVVDTDSGRSRNGTTAVQDREWTKLIAPLHLLANLDRVLDRIGSGRSTVVWTATGSAGGRPWALTRTNRFAAPGDPTNPFEPDIAISSINELLNHLQALQANKFTPVTITGVRIDAQASDRYLHYAVDKVEVKDPAGRWMAVRPSRPIMARAGGKIEGRARLVAYGGLAAPRTVGFTLTVPRNQAGSQGTLGISGGLDCGLTTAPLPLACDTGAAPTSFAQLLTSLRGAPRNDQVRAALAFGEQAAVVARAATPAISDVVTGGLEVPVRVQR